VRNTKAFRQAVADTLEHLDQLGVSGIDAGAVGDLIEQNMTAVSMQLGIQAASSWRYFDAEALAEAIAEQARKAKQQHGDDADMGQPPYPEVGNPELAILIAGFPGALASCGGDLHRAVLNLAVNAWQAGHIHGEDGCPGCESRGPSGHDYEQRMDTVRQQVPDFSKWFDSTAFNARLAETGYEVKSRR